MKKLFVLILITFIFEISEAQWQPDVRLTNATGNSYTSDNQWCISANGNIVHTVWHDRRSGNDKTYYKRSTDAGISWSIDALLPNDTIFSKNPSIAVSGSNVNVVWEDYRNNNYEIYYKRSTDDGISWGADTRLTNNTAYSYTPSIAVSGNFVYVVWTDYRDNTTGEIYYKRSTDGGTTWGTDIRLSNNTDVSKDPSIAVSGSLVNVVWRDDYYGNDEIFFKRSTDGGTTWGANTRLTSNNEISRFPSIAVSGSNVHVVWEDHRDRLINSEIYYKRSTDGGTTWGPDFRLTNDIATSASTSIAVSGSLVHVVWQDGRDGNDEIYYKRSSDGGTNWDVDTRLTNNTAISSKPHIAVSGSLVYVVWQDSRDGNYEIYYKRNPTGNFITGLINKGLEILSDYCIYQNFPNPFNPKTNIKYQIANNNYVTLKIYDVLGKEISTLVNENQSPGVYEVTFDGSNYPSGVYFCKLIAGDFKEIKKMILIR